MNEDKILPKDWVIEKLGNVCFTTSGGTPSRKIASYYQGNIPWVKSGELDKGIITKTEEYISEEALENSSAKIFPKGTLLIALYGATIGKLGFLGIDAATNQAVCGIFKNEIIDLHFLKYYLFNKRNNLIEQGAGGAQPNISQTILKDLELVIPPLPEQHRIVAKIEELFSSLDKGIESLKTAQQQLKVYRQAVLKWAFEGRFTNPNVKEGELPEGWKILRIKDVCTKITDGSHFSPRSVPVGYPYVTVRDIKNDKIDFDNCLKISEIDYKKLKSNNCQPLKNDLLFSKDGTVGKVSIVEFIKEFVVLSSIAILRPNLDLIHPKFFFHILKSSCFLYQAIEQKKGVAIRRLILRDLRELKLPLPPTLTEQNLIVQEIEKRLSVADKLEESIATALQQAEALRQSILKKAFEGKLLSETELEECRNDPNWEPASVLLERIASAKLSTKRAERHNKTSQDKIKPEKKE